MTLVTFDVLATDMSKLVRRGTLRVWKHRGQIPAVACDLATRAELYDAAAALKLEHDTRSERVRRMCLYYRA